MTATQSSAAERLVERSSVVAPADPVPHPAAVSTEQTPKFVDAMRVLATGVVILTVEVDGQPWGVTISSCSSLSASPPRLVCSLKSNSAAAAAISSGDRFGINILSAAQAELAATSAKPGTPKFLDPSILIHSDDPEVNTPQIGDALYNLDCVVVSRAQIVEHDLVVGEVRWSRSGPEHDPLLYFDRTFRALARQA
ncbi:flavin reductase family protein [Mycolicibacterium neoaurum]|uniref:flavin reductase family protein n=1 Tax=Mycolicibacterium neoaurum TaxID=1795 RepID=UPI0026713471|nr:flavin reductase family protein [Mycolicibacterium neoaurum]MDO3402680.1 flavin reductase family protein [Mycolicibacterium neoaurum]